MILGAFSVIGESSLQLILCVLAAPLLNGAIVVLKARLVSRQGPVLLQGYYDLAKSFKKEQLRPEEASWLFGAAPWFSFLGTCLCLLFIPTCIAGSPLGYAGDILVLSACVGTMRLMLLFGAWDSGDDQVFRAALRTSFLAVSVDPGLLLCLAAMCTHAGTLNIGSAERSLGLSGTSLFQPFWFLSLAAMCLLVLLETGRLPMEDRGAREIRQTLGMGVLIQHYTGPLHTVLQLADWLKQLLLLTLLVNLFFPWGLSDGRSIWGVFLALLVYLFKLFVAAVAVAVAETVSAQLRIQKISRVMFLAAFLSLLAFLSNFLIKG